MDLNNKRPWGYFEVLSDAPDHKVKRIVVEPGGILSLQKHKLRSEHWFVVSGKGIATVDGKDYPVQAEITVDIPVKKSHRLQNSSSENLVIIEVQTGKYFGEDDIERLEDKYGRLSYMLYVDGKPTQTVNSLGEAKQLAEPYIIDRKPVRIESLVSPARSRIWIYDYDVKVKDWVEQI